MNIVLQNITKNFGDKAVLVNVNATFYADAPTAIMGPSGIGKTTLLEILLGLQTPNAGVVIFRQQENEASNKIKLAAVFQEDRLCKQLSAVKNLAIVCDEKMSEATLVKNLLQVGLTKQDIYEPVCTLSGGMKRRVAIVRAMINGADVIVMDEPFKGLDDETKQVVIEYIQSKRAGRLLLVVTHNMQETKQLGATVFTLTA